MQIAYYKRWSEHLKRDMEFKVYGKTGRPLLVFPTGCGSFYEFEDFGMVEAIRPFIESGAVQVYAIDSIDCEAWLADWMYPGDRALKHEMYARYVTEEVVSFIRQNNPGADGIITTGCSIGAYHAANFFFKHPDIFTAVIALSGLYGPHQMIGTYSDENVYYNFPLVYLPNMADAWYLDRYRDGDIIVCVGQGAWEADYLRETQALEQVLTKLEVPAWFDYWGEDVEHDWPWWQQQLPYFLGHLKF